MNSGYSRKDEAAPFEDVRRKILNKQPNGSSSMQMERLNADLGEDVLNQSASQVDHLPEIAVTQASRFEDSASRR